MTACSVCGRVLRGVASMFGGRATCCNARCLLVALEEADE